jgi:hypothetical protein
MCSRKDQRSFASNLGTSVNARAGLSPQKLLIQKNSHRQHHAIIPPLYALNTNQQSA